MHGLSGVFFVGGGEGVLVEHDLSADKKLFAKVETGEAQIRRQNARECTKSHVNLYNKRRYVCLFVCLFVCSVWPAKRLGRSRRNLTHALMSNHGVFLARSMSRSFLYACGTDRSTKHPESAT